MHQFFLGQGYTIGPERQRPGVNYGLPPFPLPLDCWSPSDPARCSRRTRTAPLPTTRRARARTRTSAAPTCASACEPTINVTDQVRVHAQIDVLDNTIMGSTPDSLAGIEGYNRPAATGQPERRARRRARPAS